MRVKPRLRFTYAKILVDAVKAPPLHLIPHSNPGAVAIEIQQRAKQRTTRRGINVVALDRPPDAEWLTKLEHLRDTFRRYWPAHWPVFEACLATYVSLLLENVSQGVGVVLVGDSGSGKNTVLEAFQDGPVTVWRDKFTPASILSGFAGEGATKEDVDSRALFRTVKHSALVVGDLGPILRGGGADSREAMYAVIPPWFDGRGLQFDTGTHGLIGAKGDFSFVMLGGTTPFDMPTWRAMSSVGPRLLFLRVVRLDPDERVPPRIYDNAKREVLDQATAFLRYVFEQHQPRSISWPAVSDLHEARLADYAQLMADGQTVKLPHHEGIARPTPNHLLQRLTILISARALLWRRATVDDEDMALAKRFVRASAPSQRGRVLLAMYEGADEVEAISKRTTVNAQVVRRLLEELTAVGIAEQGDRRHREGRGQPAIVWKLADPEPDPERVALRAEEERGN